MNAVVIVDNKIGANGVIGTDFVAKATPDGRTMKVNTLSEVLSTALGQPLPYDLLRDLAPVLRLGWGECYVMVHESVPANNIPQLLAWLKANPGKATYGSAGIGNITHLGAELLLQSNGLSAAHAPYKGGSFMMTDFLAGRTQFVVAAASLTLPVAKDSRVKILANTGVRRSPQLPDVPLLSDSIPGLSVANFWGVLVPAKTPANIVRNLHDTFVKVIGQDEVKSVIAKQGVDIGISTPQEYGTQLKAEVARWTKVIKTAGIKAE
jgi:tripartite-type tricarboxylate transporter receptor subunit TctC